MKKTLPLFLILITFFSCESRVEDKNISVALVTNTSSIDDRSFNQIVWEGVLKYAKDYRLPSENYVFKTSPTVDESVFDISYFADRNFDLIIAPGYNFLNAINSIARKYPKQKFLLFDGVSAVDKNVVSITFAVNEGSFLAGAMAALKVKETKSKKVGFLGGINNVAVRGFQAGFEAGVKQIDPDIEILVQYVGDFTNPSLGQKIASKMYDEGATIIFNVAGSTGNGLIKEAKNRTKLNKKVWVVGVDKDQYQDGIYEANKSVILTSMLKKLDVATYDILTKVANGTFKGGFKEYDLASGGVGLPQNNPNLKQEWVEVITRLKSDIMSGKIIVPNEIKRIGSEN